MYNSNTDSLGLILDVEVFFSLGHCSGALCYSLSIEQVNRSPECKQARCKTFITRHEVKLVHTMQTLFCVARPAFSIQRVATDNK